MAPEESLRDRLLPRIRIVLAEALTAAHGKEVGPACVEVALNVLRFDHLAATDLARLAALAAAEAETRWLQDHWPAACAAALASEPVQDCAALVRARNAGPDKPAFTEFRDACWGWLRGQYQEDLEDSDESGQADSEEVAACELAEARLFQSHVEAAAVLRRLRLEDSSEPPSGAVAGRASRDGHGFQEALLAYQPAKGGYWRPFLKRRWLFKLRDARRALGGGLEDDPLSLDEYDSGQADGTPAQKALASIEGDREAQAEAPDGPGARTPAEIFEALRQHLWRQLASAGASGKASDEHKARANEALAILEVTYTAYVDPATYSVSTRTLVPGVAERCELEVRLRALFDAWWPKADAGFPPWNELLPAGPALSTVIQAWSRCLASECCAMPKVKQAMTKVKQAMTKAELAMAEAELAIAEAELAMAEAKFAGQLNAVIPTVAGSGAGTLPPGDRASAARQSVALVASCAAYPTLDELRRDFVEAEQLRCSEQDRLKAAYDEQIEKQRVCLELVRDSRACGIAPHLVEEARQLGFSLHEAPPAPSDDERVRVKVLDAALEEDDERRKKRQGVLDSAARRRLENELFHIALKVRPVETLEREIEYLQRRIRAGQVLNNTGETQLPRTTLVTLGREVRLRSVALAALRFARARSHVEDLLEPDGNLARYRERRSFKEPNQTPPVRQDRSNRFWVRSQKEVQRFLPGLSQPTISRRRSCFEQRLADYAAGEGDEA